MERSASVRAAAHGWSAPACSGWARLWTWRWRAEMAATGTNGHQVSSLCHGVGAVAIGSQASARWRMHQPCATDHTSQGGQAPHATRCAVLALRPRSHDGRDSLWGTQGGRGVKGQATRRVPALCALGLLAFALRPTYHAPDHRAAARRPSASRPAHRRHGARPGLSPAPMPRHVPLSSVPQAQQ